MKIGIALTGISYNDTVVPGTNWGRKRDWKNAILSIRDQVIYKLPRDRFYECSTHFYLYSYDNPQRKEIEEWLDPVRSTWLPSYEGTTMATTYLEGLKQLRESKGLSYIFATRFDILFNKSPFDFNIDFTKFNFLFREKGWRQYNFTTDTFYAFPYSMLEHVIAALTEMIIYPPPPKNIGMHNLYTPLAALIGEENINFACGDEEHLSHSNDIFTLTREE